MPALDRSLHGRAATGGHRGRRSSIASRNGLRGVASAPTTCIAQGGDPLDAIIAGVNIQELDPDDQSVGLGGLPNEDGVVQLDASCMHGPTKRAGVGGVPRGHRHAVARGEGGDGLHRPHPARRRRRASSSRSQMGFKDAEPADREERGRTGCAGRRGLNAGRRLARPPPGVGAARERRAPTPSRADEARRTTSRASRTRRARST